MAFPMQPKILSAEISNFLNISKQALHKKVKEKNIPYHKSSNRFYFEHEAAKQLINLIFEASCWSFQNLKGGIGKTMMAFSVGTAISLHGGRVALLDIDQQGNATQAANVFAENKPVLIDIITEQLNIMDCLVNVFPGFDILPSRIENAVLDNLFAINSLPADRVIKKIVDQLKKEYDFILIDCPPSLGQSVISSSLAADHIVIPVEPEKFSLSGLNVTISELEKNIFNRFDTEIDIKILLNKFDTRTSLSHKTLAELVKAPKYKDRLFESFVRNSQDFPNAIAKNKTIFDSLKNSPAKEDINLLAREMMLMTSTNAKSIIKNTEETLEPKYA